MPSHDHNSFEQDGQRLDSILRAAERGDEDAVRKALASGADVNATLKDGRNAITALLTGNYWKAVDASNAPIMSASRLNILSLLISHRDTSVYTLNATQFSFGGIRAVTPLGVAALLNRPAAVQLLLESCVGMVSVDFPDTVGGTPLMYACRDGNLEVVQHLLAHGARPDFRDAQYRTSVRYSLPHPRILWHCEDILRRHRAQEVLTHHNKRNICLSVQGAANYSIGTLSIPPSQFSHQDPDFTYTLLEAISSSQPQIIRSLLFPSSAPVTESDRSPSPNYLINVGDSRGWSPIHHCAWAARPSIESIDLLYLAGADVSLSTASEFYTPLHCLALSSSRPCDPIDAAMLYSFAVHLVRDLRAPLGSQDRNGETCIHIAAEHGHNIDVLLAFLDCDAKSTVREIRNSRGLTAAEVAKHEFRGAFGLEGARPDSAASMRTIMPNTSPKPLKSVASCSSITSITTPYDYIPEVAPETTLPSDTGILPLFEQVVQDLRFISRSLSSAVAPADFDSLEDLLVSTLEMGTMLLSRARGPIDEAADNLQKVQSFVGRVSGLLNTVSKDVEDRLEVRTLDQWEENATQRRRRTTDSGSSGSTLASQASGQRSVASSTKVGSNSDLSMQSEDESKERVITSGTVKLKNWFKKKLRSDFSRSSKTPKTKPDEWKGPKGFALRSSDRVLDAASRDLVSIEECMTMADQYIATSYHFISKAETFLSQAIRNRQVAIHNARTRQLDASYLDPTLFTLPSSPRSSPPPELVDPNIFDDELLKLFKRFLMRKVDAQLEGAYDEIEKANVWLRIVKDVVRGLKERTCV